MSVDFVVRDHSILPDTKIVEILVNGEVAAVIYPDGLQGVKLVSPHISKVTQKDGSADLPPIPAILIDFDPKPYIIEDGKIKKIPEDELCQTCKKRPGTLRKDNGLECGRHCDECWSDMLDGARSKSW